MARRRLAALAAVAIAANITPLVVAQTPAQAVQAPVAFSAVALPSWQTDGIAWATASAQGVVFVGGTFTTIRPPGAAAGTGEVSRINFAAFDAATGEPTTCAPAFESTDPNAEGTVRSMRVSPDGQTLYVGGFFNRVGGQSAQHLVAIDIASCTLNTRFRPYPNATVRAIWPTQDVVYFGGGITSVAGQPRARAAAVGSVTSATPGGLLPWAPTFDKEVRAIAVKPDNSLVVVGGDFDTVNGAGSHALVVVNSSDGATVKNYPVGFYVQTSVVKGLDVDDTGFYVGNEGTGGGVFDGRTALDWSTLDQRWRDTCLGATQRVLVYEGALYSASHAHDCSTIGEWPDGQRMHLLAQPLSGGTTKYGWFPNTNDGLGEGIGPRDMAVGVKGGQAYMWVVGEFTAVNGVSQVGITRFGQSANTAPPQPTMNVTSFKPGQVLIAWRSSWDLDDLQVSYKVFRDNNTTTPIYTTQPSTAYHWTRPQLSFVDNQPAGSTHTYRVVAYDGTTSTATPWRSVTVASTSYPYAEKVLADGANAYYRFDEPSDVFFADSSGKNNNITLRGGATFQVTGAIQGDPSKAVTLGGGSGATVYSENYFTNPFPYTVETWFKTTTTTGGKIIGLGNKFQLNSTNYDRHVYMSNDGRINFGVYTTQANVLTSTKSYNDGQWHHVVGTASTAGTALYVDGVRLSRNTTAVTSQSYRGQWRIGGDALSSWPNSPTSSTWAGTIDETAIYPSALSAQQVADHYSLGTGTVAAGPLDYYGRVVAQGDAAFYWRLGETGTTTATDALGSGDGTYTGGYTQGQAGAIAGNSNTALRLSGGFVYAKASVRSPADYSGEIWFKTTGTPGGRLFGFGNSQTGTSTSSTADRTLFMRSDGRLAFGIRSGTAINSTATYNDGQWHHAAVTQSSTAGAALYVDGNLVASSATLAGSAYTGYWRVGTDTLTGYPSAPAQTAFQGIVDEFAVSNSALSAAAVKSHYVAAYTSPDTAAPTVPAGLVTGMNAGDALLTWNPALDNVGVVRYEVHRSSNPTFTPDATTLIGSPTTTSFTDAGVTAGTWYYRVLAVDAAGNKSVGSAPVSVYITDVKPPTVPADLAVTTTSNSASLSWTASTDNVGVVEYSVYRSTTSGFTPSAANQVTTVSAGTTYTDTPLAQGTYYYVVVARDGAGNVSQKSAEVTAVVADTLAPTTPDAVTTSVLGTTTTVSWAAALDDLGVTGYLVYRGTSPDFVADASTLRATVTTLSYADVNAPEGVSYYRVAARDGAGNVSQPSVAVSGEVAPQPAVITVPASADTWVNAGATTTNYGTSTSIAVRGTPAQTALVRFGIPAAPAGKTLTSAILRIRTTADTTAGSAAPETVTTAADTWNEADVTWATRPAVGTTSLGSVAAGTTYSTTYDTPLDIAGVTALLGTQTTLALTNNSSDGLLFYSREYTSAAGRPQLILTFSPPDTTAPTAPTGLAATRNGSSVTTTWNAATDNVAVASYVVYRSATQGFTPTAGDVVGTPTATTLTESLTGGTWYYRVRAVDTSGNLGALSSELAVTVPDLVPPSQVTGLTATQLTGSVQLDWAAASDNVGVTGYQVHRGTSAGFTPSPASLIATVTGVTYTDTTAPAGTNFYKVVATDAAGNAGTASDPVSAAVADTTPPTAPTGVTASVASGTVTFAFTPATDNVAVTGYRVYRGTATGFTADATTLVGTAPAAGPVADTPGAGSFWYRLQAVDAAGNAGPLTAEVAVVVPDTTAPSKVGGLTATVTAGSVQLDWAAATDNVGVTGYQVHRGTTADFTPSAATLLTTVTALTYTDAAAPAGPAFYKTVAVDAAGNAGTPSDPASANLPDSIAPTAPTNVAATANSSALVTVTFTPATDNVGVTAYRLFRGTAPDFTADATSLVGTFTTGTAVTDGPLTVAGTYWYRLQATDAAGNLGPVTASTSVVVTLPDTTPPSVPTGLSATVAGGNVSLAWTASTDNVGVNGYVIYRGTSAGFTADASSKVGTSLGASYTDAAPGSGTWYYKVAAVDTSGNTSAASAAVSGDVALQPTTLTTTSTADSWVNAGATTTNYGSSVSIADRGTPAQIGLVRFAVPAAPAGKTLTGAVLRLRTTTDTTSGSTVAQTITTADDAWTESTVTYANRPALGTTTLGTVQANTTYATTYDTPLNASAVAALLGTQTTLAVTTTTSDGFLFYSRETGSAAARPQLILTFGSSDTTAPSVPTALTAAPSGATVALSWTASTDNVGVANYVVYRSTTSGFSPTAADAVGSPTTASFTDTPGAGTWYYKVRAVDTSANASASSAGASATVSDTTAPSKVSGVTTSVVAGSVLVGWSAATDNVGVTGYQVHRGTAADFTPSAGTLLATLTGPSYTDATAPAGTAFYKIVAVDAAGNAGAASDAASATVPDTTAPTAPTSVAGTASGPTVTITFTAATDNVGVTSYQLFRGTTSGFTADATSLAGTFPAGSAVTDGPLATGTYWYRLQAADAAGNLGPISDAAAVSVPDTTAPSAPSGLVATASGADVALTWTAATDNVAVTGYQIYRGASSGFTADDTAKIGTATATSYTDVAPGAGPWFYKVRAVDAAGNLGDPSSWATSASVDTTPPSAPTAVTTAVTGGSVAVSWTASTDDTGVTGYTVYRSATSGFSPSAATQVGTATTTSFTDAPGATGTWYYLVTAKDAMGNTSPASTETSAVVSDIVAPSKPTDLLASQSATGTTVAVVWGKSTDNTGVTGYRVYRSTDSAFTPSAATLVASPTTPTSATEASVPAGTWYYKVTALDAAGNVSDVSAAYGITVASSVTVVNVTPTADAYANSGAPGTNYGSDASLLSRFNAAGTSYLRFVLPAAPAGKTLTGAVLRLRTTTDATAGSTDRHELRIGGDDTWDETLLTWRSKPTTGPTLIGTVPSGVLANTQFDIPLSVTAVQGLIGTQTTISVSSPAGTDSLWFWSRNHGNATYRPQLILIYS